MKPSLLMITGWSYGADALHPLAELLSGPYDIRILSGAEVLSKRKIPDAGIILGWSMGGMLALEHLPAACRKLVLISSTARFCEAADYPCGVPEKVLNRMIARLAADPAAVLDAFRRNAAWPQAPHPAPVEPPGLLPEGLAYLRNTDLREKLPQIAIPVLLLHGDQDRIIPPSASEWLARHLPAATCIRLHGEGHLPVPLAIAAQILQFLDTRSL